MERFAHILQKARQRMGWSQRELAERAGIPQAHVSRIEAGYVDLRLSTLIELARLLDLDLVLTPRIALSAVNALIREVGTDYALHQAQALIGQAQAVVATLKQRFAADLIVLQAEDVMLSLTLAAPAVRTPDDLADLAHAVGDLVDAVNAIPERPHPRHLLRVSNRLENLKALRNRIVHSAPTAQTPAYGLDDEEA